jgi:hypothetical protein
LVAQPSLSWRVGPSVLFAVVLALATLPSAQGSAKPWNIDFFQGPIVNSQRAVGLGGAFVGIADGLDGHLSNPAAFAVRQPFFGNDWFDFDFGTSAYTVLGDVDYDLSGHPGRLTSATAEQGGFNLKFGRLGVGVHFMAQQFGLTVDLDSANPANPRRSGTSGASGNAAKPTAFAYSQGFGGVGLAYALRDGELVIGTLLGVGTAKITSLHTGESVDLASSVYPGSFGVLFAPRGLPYRIGMSWRLKLEMTQENVETSSDRKVTQLGGLNVPDAALMGAAFDLGMSWMFGRRTYNIRPSYGDEPLPAGAKQLKDIARPYVLVSGAISIAGPVPDGVGVAAYLTSERQASGQNSVVSVRGGAESEIIDNRLVVRGGSYIEPSRFARVPRLHVTMGGDVRVNFYWDWRVTLSLDFAANYRNSSLGLGFWH